MKKGNLAKYVKDNFPAYKDYDDTDIAEVLGEELGIPKEVVESVSTTQLTTLADLYDPNLGFFRAWGRNKKAKLRVELIQNLNAESNGVLERAVIEQAHRMGVPVDMWKQKLTSDSQLERDIFREQAMSKLRVEEKWKYTLIEDWVKAQDIEQEAIAARNELLGGIEYDKLQPAHADDLLQVKIDRLIDEIESLSSKKLPGYLRKIDDREKRILKMKEQINEGLLQSGDGEDEKGSIPATEFPGNLRKTVERTPKRKKK